MRSHIRGEVNATAHPGAESHTQANGARRSRPHAHPDLLTVAIRGEFVDRMRALSESTGMSLARLLKDALLVYEANIEAGATSQAPAYGAGRSARLRSGPNEASLPRATVHLLRQQRVGKKVLPAEE